VRPTALLPHRRDACWGFCRPKHPTASAGCEPVNLGTKGQHANSRLPKLLKQVLTALNFHYENHATSRLPKLLKQVLTALNFHYENIKILQYIKFVNTSSQLLHAFFWVILRCPNFICQLFRTLCSIFISLWRWNRQCSETSAYKIRMPGSYPEESIQHSEHSKSLKSRISSQCWHKNYLIVSFFKYKLAAFSLRLEQVHKHLPPCDPKESHPDSVWSILCWATAVYWTPHHPNFNILIMTVRVANIWNGVFVLASLFEETPCQQQSGAETRRS
jgi:hypothetical protein